MPLPGTKVKIENLSFGYLQELKIFTNVKVQLEAGEILAILGPNGSGKSTLLKLLLGQLQPLTGSIFLNGQPVTVKTNFAQLRLGYVPQKSASDFPYTVAQMVSLGRARFVPYWSTPNKHNLAVVEQTLAELGIASLRDKLITELSGGELQLVLIARALASQAQILIFDEPTTGLDFKNQYLALELLQSLATKQSCIVIFTTHNPEQALRYADKTLLLQPGGTIFGPTPEVLTEQAITQTYGIQAKILSIQF